jgi:hypothetical protein
MCADECWDRSRTLKHQAFFDALVLKPYSCGTAPLQEVKFSVRTQFPLEQFSDSVLNALTRGAGTVLSRRHDIRKAVRPSSDPGRLFICDKNCAGQRTNVIGNIQFRRQAAQSLTGHDRIEVFRAKPLTAGVSEACKMSCCKNDQCLPLMCACKGDDVISVVARDVKWDIIAVKEKLTILIA